MELSTVCGVAMVVPLLTMGVSLMITKWLCHVPKWMTLPQISQTGNRWPERAVYIVGFVVSAVLMAIIAINFHFIVIPSRLEHPGISVARVSNVIAGILLLICAIGLAIHVFAPFHVGLSDVAPGEHIDISSAIHIAAAGTFFIAALVYLSTIVGLFHFEAELSQLHGAGFMLKVLLLTAYTASLRLFGIETHCCESWARPYTISALGQWISVITFVLFIGTFAIDVRILQRTLPK